MRYKKKDIERVVGIQSKINLDISKDITTAVLSAMQYILLNMKEGDELSIRGIGSFVMRKSRPSLGKRNPKTDEEVFVPAKRKLSFRAGDILRREYLKVEPDQER